MIVKLSSSFQVRYQLNWDKQYCTMSACCTWCCNANLVLVWGYLRVALVYPMPRKILQIMYQTKASETNVPNQIAKTNSKSNESNLLNQIHWTKSIDPNLPNLPYKSTKENVCKEIYWTKSAIDILKKQSNWIYKRNQIWICLLNKIYQTYLRVIQMQLFLIEVKPSFVLILCCIAQIPNTKYLNAYIIWLLGAQI